MDYFIDLDDKKIIDSGKVVKDLAQQLDISFQDALLLLREIDNHNSILSIITKLTVHRRENLDK